MTMAIRNNRVFRTLTPERTRAVEDLIHGLKYTNTYSINTLEGISRSGTNLTYGLSTTGIALAIEKAHESAWTAGSWLADRLFTAQQEQIRTTASGARKVNTNTTRPARRVAFR
jgi:hypothetical protein